MKKHLLFVVGLSLIFFAAVSSFGEEEAIESVAVDEAAGETVDRAVDADNPGLSWLEQAVEEKLKAEGPHDFGKVIALAQRARKEGLSGANLTFCDEFIASEQLQRGLLMSGQLVGVPVAKLPKGWGVARIRILSDLEAAVKVVKNEPTAYLRIAQLNLLPEGDEKRAGEALALAEQYGRNDANVFAQITLLKAMLEKDPVKREQLIGEASRDNSDLRLQMIHAMSQIDLKQFDEALETLKKILEQDPANRAALEATFEILSNRQQFDEALKVLDVLEEQSPDDALTLQRARLFAGIGRYEEAIKLLGALREKHPEDVSILATRAAVHMATRDFDNGLKDVDAAIRIVPDNRKLPLLLLKVQLLAALERFDDVEVLLGELRKDHPGNDELTLLQIQVLSTQKKSRKALELLEPLLKKNPENVALLRILGQLLLSVNRHTDAVKALEAVVKADPEDEVSLNNLSWLLSTSPIDMVRDGRRALELATRACELTEYKKAYILSTLAAAYAELGDFDKAVEWSRKSIDLSKEDENVRDRVAELEKELDSYKKKRPYREVLDEEKE